MRYLYLAKTDGVWTMLTKDGAVLTTREEPANTPVVRVHPKSTVDYIDIEWLIEEVKNEYHAQQPGGDEVAH